MVAVLFDIILAIVNFAKKDKKVKKKKTIKESFLNAASE